MEQLIQQQMRADIHSIEQSPYNSNFHMQIQALLEYGMYTYAMDRIDKHKSQFDIPMIEQLVTLFQKFQQHQQVITILTSVYNIFDKQFEMLPSDQVTLFKLYYIDSFVSIHGIQQSLKETKHIANDNVRREIQETLHQMQGINVDIPEAEQPPLQQVQIIGKQRNHKHKIALAVAIILLIFMLIRFRNKILMSTLAQQFKLIIAKTLGL